MIGFRRVVALICISRFLRRRELSQSALLYTATLQESARSSMSGVTCYARDTLSLEEFEQADEEVGNIIQLQPALLSDGSPWCDLGYPAHLRSEEVVPEPVTSGPARFPPQKDRRYVLLDFGSLGLQKHELRWEFLSIQFLS